MGFYNFRCKKCKGTIVYTTIDGWRKVQDCNCKPQHPELLNLKALDKKEALRRSAFPRVEMQARNDKRWALHILDNPDCDRNLYLDTVQRLPESKGNRGYKELVTC
jgi:hypothetical protein